MLDSSHLSRWQAALLEVTALDARGVIPVGAHVIRARAQSTALLAGRECALIDDLLRAGGLLKRERVELEARRVEIERATQSISAATHLNLEPRAGVLSAGGSIRRIAGGDADDAQAQEPDVLNARAVISTFPHFAQAGFVYPSHLSERFRLWVASGETLRPQTYGELAQTCAPRRGGTDAPVDDGSTLDDEIVLDRVELVIHVLRRWGGDRQIAFAELASHTIGNLRDVSPFAATLNDQSRGPAHLAAAAALGILCGRDARAALSAYIMRALADDEAPGAKRRTTAVAVEMAVRGLARLPLGSRIRQLDSEERALLNRCAAHPHDRLLSAMARRVLSVWEDNWDFARLLKL